MMRRLLEKVGVLALAACVAGATGCVERGKGADAGSDLASFAKPPAEQGSAHSTFVDFGGKVHLVAYEVSPEGTAGPGSQVKIKFYWKRVGDLQPGFGLFTHLEDERGRQLANLDREGAFRAALPGKPEGLSRLALGEVYEDEQTFQMPGAGDLSPTVTLVTGVWRDQTRLPVVSGVSNGHDAAIVTHFSTGVARVTRAREPGGKKP